MDKILIVEDELAINDLIKLNLELVGYSCEQVFDGEAAILACDQQKFDLVILDFFDDDIHLFGRKLEGGAVIGNRAVKTERKAAEEKFRQINEAKDRIYKSRDIN